MYMYMYHHNTVIVPMAAKRNVTTTRGRRPTCTAITALASEAERCPAVLGG